MMVSGVAAGAAQPAKTRLANIKILRAVKINLRIFFLLLIYFSSK
jgi:hypothetical protein